MVMEREEHDGPGPPARNTPEEKHRCASRGDEERVVGAKSDRSRDLEDRVLRQLGEPRIREEGLPQPRPRPRLLEGEGAVAQHPLGERQMTRQIGVPHRADETEHEPKRDEKSQMQPPAVAEPLAPFVAARFV
jgi:hypothetical protein